MAYLSFGLVSFPVRLSAAARREPIRFHMLHRKDHSRIKEVWYCAEENKPVDRADIVKGYEHAKGEYTVVEDAEVKKIAPPTAETIEILQFVGVNEVDPIFFDKSYYVLPEAVSKPYALSLAAIRETKSYAVAKIAMHGREHVAVIRPGTPGLVLHTLYYVDELHRPGKTEGEAKSNFNRQEMELAKKLIDSLASRFKPEEYHDQYRENLEHLIELKQRGVKVTPVKYPKAAPVVDILDALKRSLSLPAKTKPQSRRTRKAA